MHGESETRDLFRRMQLITIRAMRLTRSSILLICVARRVL